MKEVTLKLTRSETFIVPVITEDDVDLEALIHDLPEEILTEFADAMCDGESLVGSPKFSPVDFRCDIKTKDGADYDPDVNFHIILKKCNTQHGVDYDYGPSEEEEK